MRSCGGCRNGDDHRRTDSGRFLNHLDRDPARQHDNAVARRCTFVCEGAGELAQRIVATDILPHGKQATCRVPKACGVYRTGLLIQYLQREERVDRFQDLIRCVKAPSCTLGGGRIASTKLSMPQSPHPVGPAIFRRRPRNSAAWCAFSQIRSSMPTSSSTTGFRSHRLKRSRPRKAKSDGKVFKVLGRRHHYRI